MSMIPIHRLKKQQWHWIDPDEFLEDDEDEEDGSDGFLSDIGDILPGISIKKD